MVASPFYRSPAYMLYMYIRESIVLAQSEHRLPADNWTITQLTTIYTAFLRIGNCKRTDTNIINTALQNIIESIPSTGSYANFNNGYPTDTYDNVLEYINYSAIVDADLCHLIMYAFAEDENVPLKNHYKDYLARKNTHSNIDSTPPAVVKILDFSHKKKHMWCLLPTTNFIAYVFTRTAVIIKQTHPDVSENVYNKRITDLYTIIDYMGVCTGDYKHPIDYLQKHTTITTYDFSEERRKRLIKLIKNKKPGADVDGLSNTELDTYIIKEFPKDIAEFEDKLFIQISKFVYTTSTVGGAPDTPLDILKSLLAAIKDDTQKLDEHYGALRQHLVQFAQRINQADVPHSAAPVDYSGLMAKYKALHHENAKLRGENQQLRGDPPLLVQQVAALSQDDALARVLKATYKRPQSRRDPNDSDAMTMMRAIRDIVENLAQPQ